MPVQGVYNISGSVQGRSYNVQTNVNSNAALQLDESCVVGNSGVLTTRTNNSVGEVTANSNAHTIVTSAVVDLYWTTGSRRGITVGTVSGTAIPLTNSGSGDNLPVVNSNVVVSTVSIVNTSIVGANVTGLVVDVAGAVDGMYSFLASGTEVFGGRLNSGADYVWFTGSGVTNPVTGSTIDTVRFSTGGTTANSVVRGSIQYN